MAQMSPRERSLAIIVVSVVAVALVYQFVVDPYFRKREELAKAVDGSNDELANAERTVRRARQLRDVETGLQNRGLKKDVAEARSQLLFALSGWAKEAGVSLTSLKEGRTTTEGRWIQINTQATAIGSQRAIANLLWRVESSTIPVRVSEMTINSRREGADDLQINLGVSTLCPNPEADKPEGPRRTTVSSVGREL